MALEEMYSLLLLFLELARLFGEHIHCYVMLGTGSNVERIIVRRHGFSGKFE